MLEKTNPDLADEQSSSRSSKARARTHTKRTPRALSPCLIVRGSVEESGLLHRDVLLFDWADVWVFEEHSRMDLLPISDADHASNANPRDSQARHEDDCGVL